MSHFPELAAHIENDNVPFCSLRHSRTVVRATPTSRAPVIRVDGLRFSSVSPDSMELFWDLVSDASEYVVQVVLFLRNLFLKNYPRKSPCNPFLCH